MYKSLPWRHIAVFCITGGMGFLCFVAIPKQCQKMAEEEVANIQSTASAPAPDNIAKRNASGKINIKTAVTGPGRSTEKFAADIKRILSLPEEQRIESLDLLFAEWVASDATAAAAYVDGIPGPPELIVQSLCQAWAAIAPQDAANWLLPKLDGNPAYAPALGALISVWGTASPREAAAWTSNLTNPTDRQQAQATAGQMWAETEPTAAADWAFVLPPEDQTKVLNGVISGWAGVDPAAAANWLHEASQAGKPISANLCGPVINQWVEMDAGAASRWLNQLPDNSPLYETAASIFAQSSAEISPKDSLVWAKSISDPTGKTNAVLRSMEHWYEKDRTEFYTALPDELAVADPEMRKSIYNLLSKKDPEFQSNLLKLTEGQDGPENAP